MPLDLTRMAKTVKAGLGSTGPSPTIQERAHPMTQSRNEPFIGRLDPSSGEALYLQLAHAIEEALKAGRLHVGDRLPAKRDVALALGVGGTTVPGASREPQPRGILRGHVGRGTIVVGTPPDARHAAL